jgi:Ser/Thr protein kinase RdoA (MazF antagonist)
MAAITLADAAHRFGLASPTSVKTLSSGLIHQTYHVWNDENRQGIVLQQLNQTIFKEPLQIIANYNRVYQHLQQENALAIPTPVPTSTGDWLCKGADGQYWRANGYMPQSYTETLPLTPAKARKAAASFAQLTLALRTLSASTLAPVLPGFHDLALRFTQFQEATKGAALDRITAARTLIAQLQARKHYVDFYTDVVGSGHFEIRIMHHDCKLSNVLFHQQTGEAICPIDLDTLMPGYYFSDLGDMVRSMAATVDEGEQNLEAISIQSDIYKALLEGYLSEMEPLLTASEKKHLHHSGLLMIYMQALRFLTDYLMGNPYYKINYPTQNYNRALNQITLLGKLEEFLKKEFTYTV